MDPDNGAGQHQNETAVLIGVEAPFGHRLGSSEDHQLLAQGGYVIDVDAKGNSGMHQLARSLRG